MNNILVVDVNWLGDAVFSLPVFKALKSAYPKARVSCLCVGRVKEVLQYCPYIDQIIIYDEKGKHRFPWEKYQLIHQLRKQRFDAAFLLHRSMTRALMVYWAGIPRRIGYSKAPWLLTDPLEMKPDDIHRCDYYLRVLEAYGIKVADRLCVLRLNTVDQEMIITKLNQVGIKSNEKFVVLNTGANWELKRWGADFFGLLAKRLVEEFGFNVVFSGALKDKALCEDIAKRAGVKTAIVAGKTTVGESLALYYMAQVVITADTGPLHLAHGVGARVIGIFGPTRPEITGPRGCGRTQILFKDVGCNKAPCYHLACRNNLCMQAVKVDDVCQALQAMLG